MVTQSNDSGPPALLGLLGRLIIGLWLGAQGGWLFGYMLAVPRWWGVCAGILAGGLIFVTLEGE